MKDWREPVHYKRLESGVYWREMLRVKLLVCFLLWFHGVVMAQENTTTGILEPNGSFTGLDGITITDTHGVLEKPLEVYIEQVTDTGGFPPLYSPNLVAATPYYRMGASERYRTPSSSTPFTVRVPLPEGAATNGLAVFFLAPAETILDGTGEDEWFSLPVTYLPQTHEVQFNRRLLEPEGVVFVIVPDVYDSLSSSALQQNNFELSPQSHGTPMFKVTCADELFLNATKGEVCEEKQINQVKTALEEAYATFHETLSFPPAALYEENGEYVVELRPVSNTGVDKAGLKGRYSGENEAFWVVVEEDAENSDELSAEMRVRFSRDVSCVSICIR